MSPIPRTAAARAVACATIVCLPLAMLSACASEQPAADSGPTCPYELQVTINQGVDFAGCRVLSSETEPKMSQQTADLIVYKNKSGFDFWSGEKDGSTQPLRIIKTNGGSGIPATYKSLDEVPYRKPLSSTPEDAQGRFFNVGTGHGCVVENTVSDGFTKVWVKQAISASELIVIQWKTY